MQERPATRSVDFIQWRGLAAMPLRDPPQCVVQVLVHRVNMFAWRRAPDQNARMAKKKRLTNQGPQKKSTRKKTGTRKRSAPNKTPKKKSTPTTSAVAAPAPELLWWRRELIRVASEPFGAVGIIASIVGACVGIPLSIYFFIASQETPAFTYSVSPRTIIVDKSKSARLDVGYEGKPLDTNVSSVQITMWNAGNAAIERPLEAVTVEIPDSRILEARVVSQSRRLIGFTLAERDAAHGKVKVSFAILEKGDGANVQIIYTGESADIRLTGAFKGQKAPIPYTRSQRWMNLPVLSTLVVIAIFISGVLLSVRAWRRRSQGLPFEIRELISNSITEALMLLGTMFLVLSFLNLFEVLNEPTFDYIPALLDEAGDTILDESGEPLLDE